MAGDWIKVEHALPDKPEVMAIASALGIDPDAVVGKLLRVWAWFDNHSADGNAPVTVRALLDRHAGVTGFVSAMLTVGWLTESNECLNVGKFDRHNGKTAKVRALGRNRTQSNRAKGNGGGVTDASPEKRREEKSIKNTLPEFCPCSIEQAISYASTVRMTPDQAAHWWNVRNASGWTKGSTGGGTPRRITSWQSDMATSAAWVAESIQKAQGASKGRIVPDIGGRRPSSVASLEDAPPAVHRADDKIEF
jgi:hypothetical protein